MLVNYEIVLKLNVLHECDTMEDLKGSDEMATDICQMICDEATTAGAVATYDILNSAIGITNFPSKRKKKD